MHMKTRDFIAATYSEKQWQSEVIALARDLGWLVYHTLRSKGSEPGFPDLVMVRGERVLFIEIKTMKGKLSSPQSFWLAALSHTTVEVYLWRPSDIQEAGEVLTGDWHTGGHTSG
jgi:hypothetical protein